MLLLNTVFLSSNINRMGAHNVSGLQAAGIKPVASEKATPFKTFVYKSEFEAAAQLYQTETDHKILAVDFRELATLNKKDTAYADQLIKDLKTAVYQEFGSKATFYYKDGKLVVLAENSSPDHLKNLEKLLNKNWIIHPEGKKPQKISELIGAKSTSHAIGIACMDIPKHSRTPSSEVVEALLGKLKSVSKGGVYTVSSEPYLQKDAALEKGALLKANAISPAQTQKIIQFAEDSITLHPRDFKHAVEHSELPIDVKTMLTRQSDSFFVSEYVKVDGKETPILNRNSFDVARADVFKRGVASHNVTVFLDLAGIGSANYFYGRENTDTFLFEKRYQGILSNLKAQYPEARVMIYRTGGDELVINVEMKESLGEKRIEIEDAIAKKVNELETNLNQEKITIKKSDLVKVNGEKRGQMLWELVLQQYQGDNAKKLISQNEGEITLQLKDTFKLYNKFSVNLDDKKNAELKKLLTKYELVKKSDKGIYEGKVDFDKASYPDEVIKYLLDKNLLKPLPGVSLRGTSIPQLENESAERTLARGDTAVQRLKGHKIDGVMLSSDVKKYFDVDAVLMGIQEQSQTEKPKDIKYFAEKLNKQKTTIAAFINEQLRSPKTSPEVKTQLRAAGKHGLMGVAVGIAAVYGTDELFRLMGFDEKNPPDPAMHFAVSLLLGHAANSGSTALFNKNLYRPETLKYFASFASLKGVNAGMLNAFKGINGMGGTVLLGKSITELLNSFGIDKKTAAQAGLYGSFAPQALSSLAKLMGYKNAAKALAYKLLERNGLKMAARGSSLIANSKILKGVNLAAVVGLLSDIAVGSYKHAFGSKWQDHIDQIMLYYMDTARSSSMTALGKGNINLDTVGGTLGHAVSNFNRFFASELGAQSTISAANEQFPQGTRESIQEMRIYQTLLAKDQIISQLTKLRLESKSEKEAQQKISDYLQSITPLLDEMKAVLPHMGGETFSKIKVVLAVLNNGTNIPMNEVDLDQLKAKGLYIRDAQIIEMPLDRNYALDKEKEEISVLLSGNGVSLMQGKINQLKNLSHQKLNSYYLKLNQLPAEQHGVAFKKLLKNPDFLEALKTQELLRHL